MKDKEGERYFEKIGNKKEKWNWNFEIKKGIWRWFKEIKEKEKWDGYRRDERKKRWKGKEKKGKSEGNLRIRIK